MTLIPGPLAANSWGLPGLVLVLWLSWVIWWIDPGPEVEMGSSCLWATGLLVDGVCHCPSSCLALGILELVPVDWRVGPCSGANKLEGGFQNTPVYFW